MASGDDWVMRPILAGCCRYESMLDGSLGIVDVLRLNDALDVQAENERRSIEASNRK